MNTGIDASSDAGSDEGDSKQKPQCLFSDRKTHGAGVCTISPHPQPGLHVLATGSYDERVRLWSTQKPNRPRVMAEVRVCHCMPLALREFMAESWISRRLSCL
jgi:hypothetical protein